MGRHTGAYNLFVYMTMKVLPKYTYGIRMQSGR